MKFNEDIFIVSAARSPIADFGGSFRSLSAVNLAVPIVQGVLSKVNMAPEQVGKVILGNTLSPLDPNIARCVAMTSGIPPTTPAFSINCACASAMQALISGISALMLGEAETALVGGVESMSNAPHVFPSLRWGQRLRHAQAIDLLWWGMQENPIMGGMGIAADLLAREYKITREEQDEFAAQSHARAVEAQSRGYFSDEIIPIEIIDRSGKVLIASDEHPRADATFDKLRGLRPAFSHDGTVTAGNASSINDGAAAILLATKGACERFGMEPLAKIGPWSIKAAEPKFTGIAPVPAIKEVLEISALSLSDLELIEINEAFASYYLACERDLKLNRSMVNVKGSGISLGHPVGATGTRLVVTLVHEMIRRDVRLGLASLCAGGGMGYALLVSRS